MKGVDDVRREAQRLWSGHRLIADVLTSGDLFPVRINLHPPTGSQIASDYGRFAETIRALEAGQGAYRLAWRDVRTRGAGQQRLPEAAVFAGASDIARLLGKTGEWHEITQAADAIRTRQPALVDWFATRPGRLARHAAEIDALLAVIDHFVVNPRPERYIRALDVPGVDTKFTEARRGILGELLGAILPASAVDPSPPPAGRGFEHRFGLRWDQPLIRLRVLDPTRAWMPGVADYSFTPDDFAALDPPAGRVFITENKINGLAFPDADDALVIFGLGYGLLSVADAPWLAARDVHYWGDIDTHGLAILDGLRAHLPNARSLLMDEATLLAHRDLWGQEPVQARHTAALHRLDAGESALFDALRRDALGARVRLEQERIRFGAVADAVGALSG